MHRERWIHLRAESHWVERPYAATPPQPKMERLLSAVAKTQEKPGRRGPRHSNGQPGQRARVWQSDRTSGEFSREGRQTDAGTQRSSGALRASRVWVRADPTLQQGGPSASAHCECEAGLWRLLHDGRWEEVVTGIAIGDDAVVDETSDQDPGARRGATLPSPGERCIAGPRFRSHRPIMFLGQSSRMFFPCCDGSPVSEGNRKSSGKPTAIVAEER